MFEDGSAIRCCRNISEEEYYLNVTNAKSKQLKKVRYNIIHDGERYRVDFYDFGFRSYVILERDVISNPDKELPGFVTKATDITNDRDYYDDSICIDYSIESVMKDSSKKNN